MKHYITPYIALASHLQVLAAEAETGMSPLMKSLENNLRRACSQAQRPAQPTLGQALVALAAKQVPREPEPANTNTHE